MTFDHIRNLANGHMLVCTIEPDTELACFNSQLFLPFLINLLIPLKLYSL